MELNLDLSKKYTYADYLSWFDNKRRELISGFIKLMTPTPSMEHQKYLGELFLVIGNYLKKKKCKVFIAPFDVRLPNSTAEINDKQIYTVVQPDLCIICEPLKIDSKGCLGAPDMIIEILSSSNSKHDVGEKFELYQQHGVLEYWIVFPHEKTINVFLLNNSGKYDFKGMFAQDSKVPVNIFEGDLIVDLAEIFEE
jgi:Uma2 family endonuclease